MGVDLTLLPFNAQQGMNFSHAMLPCERRRELWGPIADLQKQRGRDVPEGFMSYRATLKNGESGYGETIIDSYGSKIQYLHASDLVALSNHEGVTDNPKNLAAWAYLQQLPGDTWVALYWH